MVGVQMFKRSPPMGIYDANIYIKNGYIFGEDENGKTIIPARESPLHDTDFINDILLSIHNAGGGRVYCQPGDYQLTINNGTAILIGSNTEFCGSEGTRFFVPEGNTNVGVGIQNYKCSNVLKSTTFNAIPAWQNAHSYALYDVIKPSQDNDRHYLCTTAGISGGTEPIWGTTEGGTTTDGQTVWTCYVTHRLLMVDDTSEFYIGAGVTVMISSMPENAIITDLVTNQLIVVGYLQKNPILGGTIRLHCQPGRDENLHIHGIEVDGNSNADTFTGMKISCLDKATIKNCNFHDCSYTGLWTEPYTTRHNIENCHFYNNLIGIFVVTPATAMITENHFYNNESDILNQEDTTNPIREDRAGLQIIDNKFFEGAGTPGVGYNIQVTGQNKYTRTIITDNHFIHTNRLNINADYAQVEANYMHGQWSENDWAGVTGIGSTFLGNIFMGNHPVSGALPTLSGTGNRFMSNVIKDCQIGAGNCQYCIFDSNWIDAAENLSENDGSDYNEFYGNVFTDTRSPPGDGPTFSYVGAHDTFKQNKSDPALPTCGYFTENENSVTITSGDNFMKEVFHLLYRGGYTIKTGLTPSYVTLNPPSSDPGDDYWIDTITDASFKVHVGTNAILPLTFIWRAEV